MILHMLTCRHCAGLTPTGDVCLHCDAPLPRRRSLVAAVVGATGCVLLAACYGPSGRYNQAPNAAPPQPAHADEGSAGAAPTPTPTAGSGSGSAAAPTP